MKSIKLLLLLQFLFLCSFAQEKTLSPFVKSRTASQEGVVKNLVFKNESRPAQTNAAQVLKEYLGAAENVSFTKIKSETDKLGFQHEKYQQYYQGVPVEFGIYKVHAKGGKIISINGEFYPLKQMNVSPAFNKNVALTKAKTVVDATVYMDGGHAHEHDLGYEGPNTQLVILPKIEGVNTAMRLAYKLDIYAETPLYRADVYIDATTGVVIFENDKIHHGDIAATGTSLYNGVVNFTADSTGSAYRLRQTANGGGIETYDLNNGTSYSAATDVTSTSTNFTGSATAVQAHWGAENTHSYYQTKHSRNSYDGSGAVIKSYVSYSTNYVNAFWNGSVMTYGDGNGTSYSPLVPLDIVGHEITHGVVSNSANLVYSYQSGALNESFADIFGEMVELFAQGTNDWMMGTDIGIGQSGAFRSMSDPKSKGDPDTYQGQFWHTSSSDNGGVHTNSGVQNKWFYILSQGETGTNDNSDAYAVTGIGVDKAGAIAYRNLTVYLGANSNYAAARTGAIQAAVDLYGAASPEVIATTNAWYAVGVGNAWGPPPPPAPCVDGNVVLTILLDNYPGETSWDIKDTGNVVVASGGNYSGQGTTVTASAALVPGSYTFTIYDTYGDGICCAYGVGNYVIQSDTLIASGGAFGSSESTSFCVDTLMTLPDTMAPSNPTSLTSANTSTTTTDLSWTASTDNVAVTGYNVYQDSVLIATVTGTTYNVIGLTASTSYDFTVEAFDAASNVSGLSNVETVMTLAGPDTTAPSDPTSLTSANTSSTTTDLSWTASTDNVAVTGYNVYQDAVLIATVTGTTYNVIGLTPSTSYDFTVEAFDAASNVSGLSNVETVMTLSPPDTTAPSDPASLTSANTSQTTTDLSWTASTDNVGVTGYNVYQDAVLIATVTGTTYNVIGLTPSTTYDFTVEAFDAASNVSGLSNVETVTTLSPPDTTAPSDPTSLTSANTSQTTTDLSWTASTDNVGVTGYNVYQDAVLIATVTGTTYNVIGLTPSTTYDFTVEAFDAASNVSGLSNVETVLTLSPPPPPPVVCYDGNMALSIKLDSYPGETSWDITDTGNVVVASGGNYSGPGSTITATAALVPGSYTFTIYDSYGDGICCTYGNGNYLLQSDTLIASGGSFGSSESTTFCVDTLIIYPDTIAPSTPTNLASANTTQTTTDLSWTVSTDNVAVTGYNVYQDSVLIATVTTPSYAVTGLTPSTTYDFTVEAFDAASNVSGVSNIETVTTLSPPPPPAPCVEGNVAIDILLDNYPGETSWDITDTGNVVVASGGNYSGPGSAVTATAALVPGAYTFTIYDSYGDGICCTYGSGNYVVQSDTLIASGGAFGSSESTSFCVDSLFIDSIAPSAPINLMSANTTQTTTDLSWTVSTDNVAVTGYNVYQDAVLIATVTGTTYNVTGLLNSTTYLFTVNAFDAASNTSALSNTDTVTTLASTGSTTLLSQGYFETGWDGWQDGGTDCKRVFSWRSYEGWRSIRLRDNSGVGSAMTSSAFDLTPYDNVEVTFHFYPLSMEYNEDFWLRYYDGTTWSTVATYARGTDFNNKSFYQATVTLPSTQVNFDSNSRFRFQCDASSNFDHVYIDKVIIKGITGTGGNINNSIADLGSAGAGKRAYDDRADGIYPNPVADKLTFNSLGEEGLTYRIVDISGKTITQGTFNAEATIDVSALSEGVYMLGVSDDEETEFYKFIKK